MSSNRDKGAVFLVVGRFQPFHKGHLFLLKRLSSKNGNFLKIALGVPLGKKDEKNPLGFRERKKLIEQVLRKRGISRFSIFPVNDCQSDRLWLLSLLRKAGDFDSAISGNPWVRSCFRSAGLSAESHPFLEREKYSGTRIRELIKNKDPSWKRLVNSEVSSFIGNRIP